MLHTFTVQRNANHNDINARATCQIDYAQFLAVAIAVNILISAVHFRSDCRIIVEIKFQWQYNISNILTFPFGDRSIIAGMKFRR